MPVSKFGCPLASALSGKCVSSSTQPDSESWILELFEHARQLGYQQLEDHQWRARCNKYDVSGVQFGSGWGMEVAVKGVRMHARRPNCIFSRPRLSETVSPIPLSLASPQIAYHTTHHHHVAVSLAFTSLSPRFHLAFTSLSLRSPYYCALWTCKQYMDSRKPSGLAFPPTSFWFTESNVC
jgi:hypothetical protein